MEHNILKVQIDEFIHGHNMCWMEKNCSFSEIKILLKIFCRWANITGDNLWMIYNSENKEYITNIPLLKVFINDCQTDDEIEELIKELIL